MILLVSAIFNYINLTVAQTGKRAKEMATRRLLGESSAGIVTRYLTESFLFTAVCMAIGVLVAFAFKGWFDRILSTEIVIASDMGTIIGALAVLVRYIIDFRPLACIDGIQIPADFCSQRRFPFPEQDAVQQGVHRLSERHKHGACRIGIDHDTSDEASRQSAYWIQYGPPRGRFLVFGLQLFA